MRAAVEADLGVSARRLVKRAEETGWVTVGVVSSWVADGQRHVLLSVRGRRHGAGRFVVTFVDGSFEGAWWWTREHRVVVKGYREVERVVQEKPWSWHITKKLEHAPEDDELVTWTTEQPTRVALGSLAELVGVASRGVPGLLAVDSDVSY